MLGVCSGAVKFSRRAVGQLDTHQNGLDEAAATVLLGRIDGCPVLPVLPKLMGVQYCPRLILGDCDGWPITSPIASLSSSTTARPKLAACDERVSLDGLANVERCVLLGVLEAESPH
ncbi:MAG: hypothetical protein QGH76_00075 [Phycisphaerales bacterium]|nr:hypothetical protein [Phycisphaerales bacterium]